MTDSGQYRPNMDGRARFGPADRSAGGRTGGLMIDEGGRERERERENVHGKGRDKMNIGKHGIDISESN